MKVKTLIGMEVHLQLRTKSKMFCRCPVRYGAPANTLCCPVCLALPGALPVPNRDAMIMGLSLATALGCEIAELTKFDRKNYFYADLPKGYQISQFDRPLGTNGSLEIVTEKGVKQVRIRRLHIEEDVGKNVHEKGHSAVDFNRAGTPLIEIVTEPDMNSPEEARAYLGALRTLVHYLDISEGNMQEGNLRCEPNVNIHIKDGDGGDIVKTPVNEIKNLNSVRHVERAVRNEVERHVAAYRERGAAFSDEPRCTLGYDEKADRVYVMREKEEAHDYRYFPEPDIPPIHIGAAWRSEASDRVPELPWTKRARFGEAYGLSAYDANALCRERSIADYFEQVVKAGATPKSAANWVQGELGRHANERDTTLAGLEMPPQRLAALISLVDEGTVSRQAAAKELLPRLLDGGGDPAQLVDKLGLAQVHDEDLLLEAAKKAVDANPGAAADFKAGKKKALGALMGFVMKETRGKANPKVVQDVLRAVLEER
ncbi:MAG: Asp-tRNA(Asn)/Glu-tRNA(Gln) amidotransferase subunit GatB [Planctomycetota bacterium]|jgi:aspartyl-tRNA(Asn)/glutamyl-tRNA(Gln) amidotransferase subunit B